MNELTTRQRALLDYLAAYHETGLSQAERNALPMAVLSDLDALIEIGAIEVRFIPRPPETAAIRAAIADAIEDGALANARPAPIVRAHRPPRQKKAQAAPKPLVAKARAPWDAERKQRFLDALAETGNVTKAHDAAGAASSSAYYVRSHDAVFREAWDNALAANRSGAPKAVPEAAPAPASAKAAKAPAAIRPAPPPGATSEIAAAALDHQAERKRIEQLRPPMSVDEAKLILQRKGRVVYRASVDGGPKDRWVVSGFAEPIDDAMLKAEAERVEGKARK